MPLAPEPLDPDSVAADPIAQFRRWYDEAVAAGVRQPDAMTLATATPDGAVSARTVLLRGLDEHGFAFFTNLESAKGRELAANPRAALVFHWREQERQVRVVGPVRRVGDDEAARATGRAGRAATGSSAWASPQSAVVDRAELDGARRRGRGAVRATPSRRCRRSGAGSSSASTSSSAGRAGPIACTTACATARDGRGGWLRERLAP